jgi:hypothetical protein
VFSLDSVRRRRHGPDCFDAAAAECGEGDRDGAECGEGVRDGADRRKAPGAIV